MVAQRYDIHPVKNRLEKSHKLLNYGGVGIDWVEFDDGVKAPMLSLRAANKSDRDELTNRKYRSD